MTEDEQAFWDRAFCAALAGLLSGKIQVVTTGGEPADARAIFCGQHADAALSARRLRTEKDKP